MDFEDMHSMSLDQLDNLWKYEFRVASALTGLPLRTCSAKPNNALSNLYPAMKEDEFRLLKQDILKMWVKASYYFKFKNVDGRGWGVFMPSEEDEGYPTTGLLSPSKYTVMGWVAKAPNKDHCPTAHRYLRSPVGKTLYLGGPISLVNQDTVGRISVHLPSSEKSAARHLVKVLSLRKLLPGSELLWTYVDKKTCRERLNMSPVTEWFLTECCSEKNASVLDEEQLPGPSTSPTAASEPAAKRKKRVVGGIRPLTKSQELPRFCLCTYCGLNVDAGKGYSPNLKRHLSLHHAVDVVKEIGKDPLAREDRVSAQEFTLHLDKVDNVLDGLHKRFINCQPACNFIKNFEGDTQLREGEPLEEEKERVFKLFIQESMLAFKRYQIVFLKGCSIPTKYDDLLPCSKYTNHNDIIWHGKKPSNINFSINKIDLEEKEITLAAHKLQVEIALKNITTNYQMEDEE